MSAAAFGRLCVETIIVIPVSHYLGAAAFGRLCVETSFLACVAQLIPAAAFGRLCVETTNANLCWLLCISSRLRAAVC